ncbi:hypothetical protein, partial [Pseudomonas gingeri]
GTSNPNNLRSEFGVVALVKFCGFILGNFSNAGTEKVYNVNGVSQHGNHAEDQFMSAWEEFTETSVYKEILALQTLNQKKPYITIKLSRSPCSTCTPKLIEFIKSNKIKIRMKLLQLYGGEEGLLTNRLSVLALISYGYAIKVWDAQAPRKGFRARTKANLPHEMMFATIHLKNSSRDEEMDADRLLSPEEEEFLNFRHYVEESSRKIDEHLLEAYSYFSNPPDILKLDSSKREKARKLQEYMKIIKKEPDLYNRVLLLEQYYTNARPLTADGTGESGATSSNAAMLD